MQRLPRGLIIGLLALLLGAGAGFAQDSGGQTGGEAAQPATAEPATAEPAQETAHVRIAHFAPNAPQVSITLTPREGDQESGPALAPEELQNLAYEQSTGYLEVPAGHYNVTLAGADGSEALTQELDFNGGGYYTVAAIGLVLPADAEAAQEGDDGGFLGFIRDLFGGGDDQDALRLQLRSFEDDLERSFQPGQTLLRLVHASPGTEDIALAIKGEQGTLARDVNFGDASRYATYDGSASDLEIRISGSRAATLDLADSSIEAGTITTVFVIGTPVEQAPLKAVTFSDAPLTPPSEPAAPATSTEPAAPAVAPAAPNEATTGGEGGDMTGGATTGGEGGDMTGGGDTGGGMSGGTGGG